MTAPALMHAHSASSRWQTAALLFSWLCVASAQAEPPDTQADFPPVMIDFFFEPGCPDCLRVRTHILPELSERLEGFFVLREFDIGVAPNLTRLVAYQEKLAIRENEPVLMVVDYHYVFNGYDSIETGLLDRVERCVTARTEEDWQPPLQIEPAADSAVLGIRVGGFTLPMVLGAGLIDGVNPCAISALVFFMSLLAVSKVKGKAILLVGAGFCTAAFLTYTALGFGLLRALHLLPRYGTFRHVVDAAMATALVVLAFVSFSDALRYATTGDPGRVRLQLSQGMKRRIHDLMRSGLGSGRLLLGGLFIGGTVTVIESVCTGQVYVPTLVMVIRSGSSGASSRALGYLLAYNAMFVAPLVAVFILTFLGLRARTLLAWSKHDVVVGKILLGLFFLASAVIIALVE